MWIVVFATHRGFAATGVACEAKVAEIGHSASLPTFDGPGLLELLDFSLDTLHSKQLVKLSEWVIVRVAEFADPSLEHVIDSRFYIFLLD